MEKHERNGRQQSWKQLIRARSQVVQSTQGDSCDLAELRQFRRQVL